MYTSPSLERKTNNNDHYKITIGRKCLLAFPPYLLITIFETRMHAQLRQELHQILGRNTLSVNNTPDSLSKEAGNSQLLHFGAITTEWYRVGKDHLLQNRVLYPLTGRSAHHAVAGESPYRVGTLLLEKLGSFCDRTGSVHHIIHKHYVVTLNITNHLHGGHLVGPDTRLVAHHHRAVEELGVCAGSLATAHVGRSDAQILEVEALNVRNKD